MDAITLPIPSKDAEADHLGDNLSPQHPRNTGPFWPSKIFYFLPFIVANAFIVCYIIITGYLHSVLMFSTYLQMHVRFFASLLPYFFSYFTVVFRAIFHSSVCFNLITYLNVFFI
jgi:hypothetical protein